MKLRTDWVLFLTIVGMVCFGLVIVFSASSIVATRRFGQESYFFFVRQGFVAVVSFLVLMVLANRDYRELNKPKWVFSLLGLAVFFLILVLFIGSDSQRWIDMGLFSLQPSEFAKPVLVVFIAFLISHRSADINGIHTIAPAVMVMCVLAGLVGVADFGTALVLAGTAAVIFFVAGLKLKFYAFATPVLVLAMAVMICAKPYRLQRVIHYVDPEHKILDQLNPGGEIKRYAHSARVTDTGHQARQSKIALGSGGLVGQGLMGSSQKLFFLPEAHTDFIYAVVGEELGLLGTTLVLAGFVLLLWRGLLLYWVALDSFGRYLAIGVTVSIVLQAFINMSVVLDLGPTKGIPLPLISYGGSSLLSSMISLGLLLSVSVRARLWGEECS